MSDDKATHPAASILDYMSGLGADKSFGSGVSWEDVNDFRSALEYAPDSDFQHHDQEEDDEDHELEQEVMRALEEAESALEETVAPMEESYEREDVVDLPPRPRSQSLEASLDAVLMAERRISG